mmetsp:Transcript_49614/g.124415  ORF Transcript_49614/g.124415 Transcript_49614/m.124415 type:complete len:134 (-) Transcript_49614:155-556(-)
MCLGVVCACWLTDRFVPSMYPAVQPQTEYMAKRSLADITSSIHPSVSLHMSQDTYILSSQPLHAIQKTHSQEARLPACSHSQAVSYQGQHTRAHTHSPRQNSKNAPLLRAIDDNGVMASFTTDLPAPAHASLN